MNKRQRKKLTQGLAIEERRRLRRIKRRDRLQAKYPPEYWRRKFDAHMKNRYPTHLMEKSIYSEHLLNIIKRTDDFKGGYYDLRHLGGT